MDSYNGLRERKAYDGFCWIILSVCVGWYYFEMIDKQNTQAIFHFLLSELIVECSEHIKEGTPDTKIHEIGKELGFKSYPQICVKGGITERASSIVDALKNIKAKVFKHLFNYELSP